MFLGDYITPNMIEVSWGSEDSGLSVTKAISSIGHRSLTKSKSYHSLSCVLEIT